MIRFFKTAFLPARNARIKENYFSKLNYFARFFVLQKLARESLEVCSSILSSISTLPFIGVFSSSSLMNYSVVWMFNETYGRRMRETEFNYGTITGYACCCIDEFISFVPLFVPRFTVMKTTFGYQRCESQLNTWWRLKVNRFPLSKISAWSRIKFK